MGGGESAWHLGTALALCDSAVIIFLRSYRNGGAPVAGAKAPESVRIFKNDLSTCPDQEKILVAKILTFRLS